MSEAKTRGMVGVLKRFSYDDHQRNDQRGRDAFRNYLNRKLPHQTIDNPNPHGIDLLSLNEKQEVIICWEIEVREKNWKGNINFPFSTINCIERKDHQWKKQKTFTDKIPFSLAENYEVYYVQLNDICTRCVVIDSETILKFELIPWSNRKSQGEYVRQIPVKLAKSLKIN